MNTRTTTVLYTIEAFNYGGVTTITRQYASIAALAGHTAIILGYKDNIPDPQVFFGKEIRIFTILSKMEYSFFPVIANCLRYWKALSKVRETYHVDVIHLSTTWSSIFTLLYVPYWSVPKVITFHGVYDLEDSYDVDAQGNVLHDARIFLRIKRFILRKLQHITLFFSKSIICLSEYSRQLIGESFSFSLQKKVSIIAPYVPSSGVQKKSRNTVFTVVNIGRMEPRKGIDILLRAAAIVAKQHRFKLYISAPFDMHEHARFFSLYERLNLFRTVHFLHKSDSKQRKLLLDGADLFVFPSRDLETFGISMLEALSYGVPVLGTPTGAIPEVLAKIDERLVVQDSTPLQLAEKIIWYMKLDDSEKKKIVSKSTAIVAKDYSRKKISERILILYQKNLEKP